MAATYQWVVLQRLNFSSGTSDQDYEVAFYFDVPTGTANADGTTRADFFKSALATSRWAAIPAADLLAIQNGTIVESVERVSYPTSMSGAAILADLDAKYTSKLADLSSRSAAIGDRYGLARRADGTLRNTKVG